MSAIASQKDVLAVKFAGLDKSPPKVRINKIDATGKLQITFSNNMFIPRPEQAARRL